MNYKNLTDVELAHNLKKLVEKERTLLAEILYHLMEVDDRKLHLKLAYRSLHAYCVEELSYPGDQAYRRIAAMQILRDCPQIEESIQNGSLNLTHLGQAGAYFNSKSKKDETLAHEEKINILSELKNKPTRQTEKIFAKLDPDAVRSEKVRPIAQNLTEIRFVATDELLKKLEHFKSLDSHAFHDSSFSTLFERLVDLALAQKEKALTKKVAVSAVSKNSPTSEVMCAPEIKCEPEIKRELEIKQSASSSVSSFSAPRMNALSSKIVKRSRFIPISIKRKVYLRDEGKCTYQNSDNGKQCGSKNRLQYDHIHPFAKGGAHSAENLTLRCQNHNLLLAEQHFGKSKIRFYANKMNKVNAGLPS